MAFSQEDIDALKAAIVAGKGAKNITFSDQSVTFHSIEDMLKLLALMESEVAGSSGSRTRYAATSKGV